MAQLRRAALAVTLVVAMLAGGVPGVAGRLAGSFTDGFTGQAWVGHDQRAMRVRITGEVPVTLSPGTSSSIRIGLRNANPGTVTIRRVRVTIVGVVAPRADAAHPCTVADFRVRQMQPGHLDLPPRRFVDLAALGIPVQGWPQVTMRNRPVNQDGCQGASLRLSYRAHRVVRRWPA